MIFSTLAVLDFWTDLGKTLAPGLEVTVIYMLGMASAWAKNKFKKHESVADTYEFNYKISVATELCREAMGPTAMRIYYTKFHNGDYFDDGSPIQKKSRVVEALRPGIMPLPDKYATMIVSMVIDEIRLIKEEGPSYTFVDDLPDGTFKYICKEYGVQAVAREAVYKGKPYPKNLIGFVGIDFDGDLIHHRPLPPDQLDQLGVLATKIGELALNYKGSG